MISKFIEATNGFNWGKFQLLRWDHEWEERSEVDGRPLIQGRGWTPDHILVLDLQTGEGAVFGPWGWARADLNKHRIWVCPMFEPFLDWLYEQDLALLQDLPDVVNLPDAEAALHGYRRAGICHLHPEGCPPEDDSAQGRNQ